MKSVQAVLATAALAGASAAWAAEVLEPKWDAQGQFAVQRELTAGAVLEVCEALQPGVRTDWSFQASAPLAFNIHHHEGKAVHFAEQRKAVQQLKGQFAPKAANDYCWMWQAAKGAPAPVTVKVELQRR